MEQGTEEALAKRIEKLEARWRLLVLAGLGAVAIAGALRLAEWANRPPIWEPMRVKGLAVEGFKGFFSGREMIVLRPGGGDGGPSIVLEDIGERGIEISTWTEPDGGPAILFRDHGGVVRLRVGLDLQGQPTISHFDERGRPLT